MDAQGGSNKNIERKHTMGGSRFWDSQYRRDMDMLEWVQHSGGVKEMKPDSSQWYPLSVNELTGTNWNTGKNIWRNKKTLFYQEYGQTLTLVAQRCWGISILGDTRSPAEQYSKNLVVADSALSREAGLDDLQRYLPTSAIPWYCETHYQAIVLIWDICRI